ncbi:MAG: 3'(2'),5'-bisphosphate nucleotidase CysQ [Nitrospinae bacterium CG11_big_fil_rev_8_21_14_0_20_56_8]|nr:MAG: 3'(2'),5'-bisphosphate nucleotidase CysQ [Nitrospinae bacterium CG11_big_fil_rev_8_21_14_0_20_56_8]
MMDALVAIARGAGAILTERFHSGSFEVHIKPDRSPVTTADLASDEFIRNALAKACSIPPVTEETPVDYETRRGWAELFLIDPLDGTKDFIAHNPDFAVNIAYVKGGRPVIGVVFAPLLDEMFYAERGRGAFLEKGGIRYSLPRTRNKGCVIGRTRNERNPLIRQLVELNGISENRVMGSAIRYPRLAEGVIDIHPGLGESWEWDTAAGQIMVTETGGRVMDLGTGTEPVYNKPHLRNSRFIATGQDLDPARLKLPEGIRN